jgi:anti-sigma28 factor (negative regulator of flagellin synthesis)
MNQLARKTSGPFMQYQTPVTPVFDVHKVEAIRHRLNDDNYIVDSRQIADKIIDLEKALSEMP